MSSTALDRIPGLTFNPSDHRRLCRHPRESRTSGDPSMYRKQIAVALAVLFVGFAASLVLADKANHKGEILAIDQAAKTVTIRVDSDETGQKETHVYEVQQSTTIKDKTSGKVLAFTDLKVGDKVNLHSKTEGKKRVALSIETRPDKDKGKK